MIKPPITVDAPSPLLLFVSAITLLGTTRTFFDGLRPLLGDEFRTLLEDISLFANDKMVIGLRTPWVRRVVVPVINAQRALDAREGTQQEKGRAAVEILCQCNDDHVRNVCTKWVKENYHV
jgi:hypothetical protein